MHQRQAGRAVTPLTEFRRADEVADAAHAAVVLPLRLVELHADPLTAGELRGAAEPQCACLREGDDPFSITSVSKRGTKQQTAENKLLPLSLPTG